MQVQSELTEAMLQCFQTRLRFRLTLEADHKSSSPGESHP
jgi:hypothetical protein